MATYNKSTPAIIEILKVLDFKIISRSSRKATEIISKRKRGDRRKRAATINTRLGIILRDTDKVRKEERKKRKKRKKGKKRKKRKERKKKQFWGI